MKLFLAAALAITAPAQKDVYEASWSSSHWSLMATEGEAPERVAVLIDRESVGPGATANLREFNLLSTVEGRGDRWGIIARIRVDCDAKAYMELGRVLFAEGDREEPTPPGEMIVMKSDSGIYRALPGICRGDWSGFKTVDVPATSVARTVFAR